MSKYSKILIKNISALLQKSKMNQSQLAAKLKTKPGAVNNWMNGKNVPSLDSIGEIAAVFGISLAELLQAEETPEPNIVELPTAVKMAIEEGNAKLKDEINEMLLPFLSRLKGELGVEEVIVRPVPKEKLSGFLNSFLREVGFSADFYRLLDKNADSETLRIEFLREIGQALLSADESTAAKAKKIIAELAGSKGRKK